MSARSLSISLSIIVLALVAATPGCDGESGSATARNTPPVVAVGSHPIAVFVERLAGPHVELAWRVPDGIDPANWRPTADDVAGIQSADLILLNGAGYESWLPTASLPAERVVDTTAGLTDRLIRSSGPVHSHGPDGEHSHAGLAPITWLDPDLMEAQAEAVKEALVALVPAHQESIESNFGLLRRDIAARFAGIEQAINHRPTLPVVYSHPVYQYLQRRYGMNGVAVHWDPRSEPTPNQLAELDRVLLAHPSDWFIWEAEPIPGNVRILQDRGLRSVVFDPAGAPPVEGDLFDSLDAATIALRRVYGIDGEG